MIVFISCVKSKQNKQCTAKELYTSDLFKKSLQYAKQLKPRKIYILSAKYGVLELDDIVGPYELTLNKMTEYERKVWAYKVVKQCEQKGVDFTERAVFLCGENYRKYVMQKFKNAEAPLKKLGIGQQLKFYKDNIKEL